MVRVAANLFAAGQDTTVRLLGSALQLIAERPDLQQLAARPSASASPTSSRSRLRIESPVKGDFRLARVATQVGGVDIPAGTTVMVLNGAANRDPRQFDDPDGVRGRPAERPPAPGVRPRRPHLPRVARSPGPRPGCRSSGCSTAWPTSGSPRREHGPAGARRFKYVPTFILRGLTRLHLEFTPVGA